MSLLPEKAAFFNSVRVACCWLADDLAAGLWPVSVRIAINNSHGRAGRIYKSRLGISELPLKNSARDSIIFGVAEGDQRRSNAPFCGKSFRRP
jgi:hypothetical protein